MPSDANYLAMGSARKPLKDATSARTYLHIEMAYDDYSPYSQESPSRIESVLYASRELAEEAMRLTDGWIRDNLPEDARIHFRTYTDPVSREDPLAAPEVPEDLIREMAQHYADDEDICEECGADVPEDADDLTGVYHELYCSLYEDEGISKEEFMAILRAGAQEHAANTGEAEFEAGDIEAALSILADLKGKTRYEQALIQVLDFAPEEYGLAVLDTLSEEDAERVLEAWGEENWTQAITERIHDK